ncbi:Sensor domain of 2-component histidine kinase [compost metagenome]
MTASLARILIIDAEHQRTLHHYGEQAEALYRAGDHQALQRWLRTLQQEHLTQQFVAYAAVRGMNETRGHSMPRPYRFGLHPGVVGAACPR